MGQDRNKRQTGVLDLLHGRGRLRHLQERKQPLLHPGAARSNDGHECPFLLAGQLRGAGQFLADDHTHAAAEEAEIEHEQRDGIAVQGGTTVGRGIATAVLALGLLQFVLVRLGVREEEGIS